MAVGQTELKTLLPVSGVSIGVACAGIKYPDHPDLVVFELDDNSSVAGVFTKNAFCAAPVTIAKQHLDSKSNPKYLLINTGNANAGTGQQGMQDAIDACQKLATIKGVELNAVLPFSTGVIGEHLPMVELLTGIENVSGSLKEDLWLDAAQGILTTDTIPKGTSKQFQFEGKTITITGISKGSGMIKPNMATMLSFVATDAKVSPVVLQSILSEVTETSFNRITVDGDTSTNDSSILIATGKALTSPCDDKNSVLYLPLKEAIAEVMLFLAQSIIRDGEGATKFVTVEIASAKSTDEALSVAYTIAHSPLVKTALNASDANWGRILAAVGRGGIADLDVNQVSIHINGVKIVEQGGRANSYTEEQGTDAMAQENIHIRVELNRGDISEKVYTTDLSVDYVKINADYRT